MHTDMSRTHFHPPCKGKLRDVFCGKRDVRLSEYGMLSNSLHDIVMQSRIEKMHSQSPDRTRIQMGSQIHTNSISRNTTSFWIDKSQNVAPIIFFELERIKSQERSDKLVYTLLSGLECSPCQTTKTAVPLHVLWSRRVTISAPSTKQFQHRRSHSSSDSANQE